MSYVLHVLAYISTIISAAADEDPDEMMCFPEGLQYLLTFPTRMSKISQKSMCLYANFSEKGCVSWVLKTCKRTISTKRLIVFCIQTHIFVRVGQSVNFKRRIINFYIQFYLQPNSF